MASTILLFMNDLKLFVKSRNQIESLVRTIKIYYKYVGMTFGITKWALLTEGKRVVSTRIKLPTGETIADPDEKVGTNTLVFWA